MGMKRSSIDAVLARELITERFRFDPILSMYAPKAKLKKSGRLNMLSAKPAATVEFVSVSAIHTIDMENADVPVLAKAVCMLISLKFLPMGSLCTGPMFSVSKLVQPSILVQFTGTMIMLTERGSYKSYIYVSISFIRKIIIYIILLFLWNLKINTSF
jgi:hypothetical protein